MFEELLDRLDDLELTGDGQPPALQLHQRAQAHPAEVLRQAVIGTRVARAGDAAFLTDMLVEAVCWDAGAPRLSRDEVLARPENRRYVEGWPRAGDLGIIAEDGERPAGAAWLRFFTSDEPGYGYVADEVPEVSIAVRAERHAARASAPGCSTSSSRASATDRDHRALPERRDRQPRPAPLRASWLRESRRDGRLRHHAPRALKVRNLTTRSASISSASTRMACSRPPT